MNIDNYYRWLIKNYVSRPATNLVDKYTIVLKLLHKTEFKVICLMDRNRVDGCLNRRVNYDYNLMTDHQISVSLLEIVIELSVEMYELGQGYSWNKSQQEWFWLLLANAGLLAYDRTIAYLEPTSVDDLQKHIHIINNRQYNTDGSGGFFTLKDNREDQRMVELWYQMSAYMQENYQF